MNIDRIKRAVHMFEGHNDALLECNRKIAKLNGRRDAISAELQSVNVDIWKLVDQQAALQQAVDRYTENLKAVLKEEVTK